MRKAESAPLERSMGQGLWWSREVSWVYEGWGVMIDTVRPASMMMLGIYKVGFLCKTSTWH